MAVFIVIIMSDLDEEDFNLDYPISQASVLLFKKETSSTILHASLFSVFTMFLTYFK